MKKQVVHFQTEIFFQHQNNPKNDFYGFLCDNFLKIHKKELKLAPMLPYLVAHALNLAP